MFRTLLRTATPSARAVVAAARPVPRAYSAAAGLTHDQIKERVFQVLKDFEKVDASKVRQRARQRTVPFADDHAAYRQLGVHYRPRPRLPRRRRGRHGDRGRVCSRDPRRRGRRDHHRPARLVRTPSHVGIRIPCGGSRSVESCKLVLEPLESSGTAVALRAAGARTSLWHGPGHSAVATTHG
jgi:hypothetical protein